MKKLLLIILIIIFALNVLLNFNISILGFRIYKIVTPSMVPNINVNDIVLIKKSNKYKINDIITYKNDNEYITHRIISINDNKIVTKGDNNNTLDASILIKDIVGKVIWKTNFINYILYLFFIIILIIILLINKEENKKIFKYFLIMYIFLISNIFITKTYSKIVSSVSRKGNLAVAKFNVSAMFSNESLNLISGNNIESYMLNVINNSEVAINYSIVISNVPDGITVSLDDGVFIDPDSNHQIKFISGKLIPTKDSATKSHLLHFKSLLDLNNLFNYEMQIEVVFTQESI